MGSSNKDGLPNLTDEYNENSIGCTVKHVLKHLFAMGVMMGVIGLASPAFAMAAPIDPLSMDFTEPLGRTPGDLVVQSTYGTWEMLDIIIDTFTGLLSIGGELVTNLFNGNFMPSTLDNLVMSHSGEHIAGEHIAEAGGHAAIEHTPNIAFDEWLRNAISGGTLDIALEDSEAAGQTLEEYVSHEGH